MKKRDSLADMGFEDSLVLEPDYFDDAIIGVSTNGQAIYSYNKLIEVLTDAEGMTEDEAADWLHYNTIGSLNSQDASYPIIMYDLE